MTNYRIIGNTPTEVKRAYEDSDGAVHLEKFGIKTERITFADASEIHALLAFLFETAAVRNDLTVEDLMAHWLGHPAPEEVRHE